MSVYYATVRISPWHWLSLRISSMAWSIRKVSPRTPHVWRNTFNKRQVARMIITQETGPGWDSPDWSVMSRWLSCQTGGCHRHTHSLTQCSTDSTITTDFHSNHNPSQQSQCNNVRDTVTNNTSGRIIINDITIQGLIKYTLPLRSCNTMSTDVLDGVEYFNTVVVQPHRKLVTNQGRGYHVRCRYQTEEKLLQNDFNVR